jgi:glycosyltransferase involved in cell wall biosynthesis
MLPSKPKIDLLIAVYPGNIMDISQNLPKILGFFRKNFQKNPWRITLAYNGSNQKGADDLLKVIQKTKNVRLSQVQKPGKGNAVLNGIAESSADIVCYMDADLATDVKDLPQLIQQVENGAHLATGSRYHPKSQIKRDFVRWIVSKIYTGFLLKIGLGAAFTDPQCGFKAVNKKEVLPILMTVQDAWFFFETELQYRVQQNNLKIKEIPVKWTEMENSSVALIPTIINFLKNLYRIKFEKIPKRTPWKEEVKIIKEASFSKA